MILKSTPTAAREHNIAMIIANKGDLRMFFETCKIGYTERRTLPSTNKHSLSINVLGIINRSRLSRAEKLKAINQVCYNNNTHLASCVSSILDCLLSDSAKIMSIAKICKTYSESLVSKINAIIADREMCNSIKIKDIAVLCECDVSYLAAKIRSIIADRTINVSETIEAISKACDQKVNQEFMVRQSILDVIAEPYRIDSCKIDRILEIISFGDVNFASSVRRIIENSKTSNHCKLDVIERLCNN